MSLQYKLAVVGRNIGYSKSPQIHHDFARKTGLDISYVIKDAAADNSNLTTMVASLQAAGFTGCNITVPFKLEAYQLADQLSDYASVAGSVNTMLFNADGSIYGDNTDGPGLVTDIQANLGFALAGKKVLICGAGGAVQGIVPALVGASVGSITIANRTVAKAQGLADQFSGQLAMITGCGYQDLSAQQFDLLIDGTSMRTLCPPLPANMQLTSSALVYDLSYAAGKITPIMAWAHQRGCYHAYDGLGMLVEQAALSFCLWTGAELAVVRHKIHIR